MAIPEFILRKLIVPGSLRSAGNGFQFVLLNTFAPATITSFNIMVGQKNVPLASIKLSPANLETFSADKVNRENPLLAAVGVAISLLIENQSLDGPVKISVDTKEIGPFEFTLADSVKKQNYKGFRPAWLSAFAKPIEAKVLVKNDYPLGEASPFLLGQFVEHLERCIYDGIWTKDGSALRPDTLKLLKELRPPMIRYPGGNFASGYHWEDGIGPHEKRPSRHDAAWQAEEINQVGTDEFLALCEELDTEPYLVVNDGSGTPEEAARWVAYCNSAENSEQGRRRAANGHPQPYNVKYWGVGNEVWGPWQIGTTSAAEYAHRLKRFSAAMKAVDSTIKIIAVGNNLLSDEQNSPEALWNKEVLDAASDDFDFLSWHIYQPEQDSWKETYDPRALFASVCAAPLDFEKVIQRVDDEIQKSSGKGRITQCIDEWNIWLPPGEKAKSMHQVTYTARDSLYVAGIINVLYRNFKSVDIANLAQLVNVLPLIQTNDKTAIATSIYYPFVLAAEMEDYVLGTEVESPTFNSEKIGNNVLAHENIPYLDVAVARSNDGETVTLLILNRHPEKRMKLEIDFSEKCKFNSVDLKEIKAGTPLAYNSFENPTAVRIYHHNFTSIVDSQYLLRLAPASITLCTFVK